jgi:hypothetical protein
MRVDLLTRVWALARMTPKISFFEPSGLRATAARDLRKPPSQLSTCG